jgi:hypothetical protein
MSGNCAVARKEDASNAAEGSGVRALYRPADGRPDPSLLNLYPAFYALVWFRSMAIFLLEKHPKFVPSSCHCLTRYNALM